MTIHSSRTSAICSLVFLLAATTAFAQNAPPPANEPNAGQSPTRIITSKDVAILYTNYKGAETLYWNPSLKKIFFVAKLPLFSPTTPPNSMATLRAKALNVVEGKGLMINAHDQDMLVLCEDPAKPLFANNIFVGIVAPQGTTFTIINDKHQEVALPVLDLCTPASREDFNTFMLQGGSITLPVPRKITTEEACKKCKNTGKLGKDNRKTVPCTTCGGSGEVDGLNNTRKRCAGCGGTGQRAEGKDLRRQCDNCGGHGKYDVISFAQDDITFVVGQE